MRRFWLFFLLLTSCQTQGVAGTAVKDYLAQFAVNQPPLSVSYRFPENKTLSANSPIIIHFSQPMVAPQATGQLITDYQKWVTVSPAQSITAEWRTPATLYLSSKMEWAADEIEVKLKSGRSSLLGAALLKDVSWVYQVEPSVSIEGDRGQIGSPAPAEILPPTVIGESLQVQVTVPKFLRLGDVATAQVELENTSDEAMTAVLSATSDRLRTKMTRQNIQIAPKTTKSVGIVFETAALLDLVSLDEIFSQDRAQANLRFEIGLGDRQAIVDRKLTLVSDIPRDSWQSGGMIKTEATFNTAVPANAESGEVRLRVTEDRLDWAVSVAKILWSKKENGEATRIAALYPALLFRSEPAFTAAIAESLQGDDAVKSELQRLSQMSFQEEEQTKLSTNFSHILFLADFVLSAKDAGFDIAALSEKFIPYLQKLSLQTVSTEGDYFQGVSNQIALDDILAELGFDSPDAYARYLPFWDHFDALTKARLAGLLVRSNPSHAYVKQWFNDLASREASAFEKASTRELWASYQSVRRIDPNDQDLSPVLLRTLIERGGINQDMWSQVDVLRALSSYTGDIRLSEAPSRVELTLNNQLLTEFNLIDGHGSFVLPSDQLPKNMSFALKVKEGGPVYMTIQRRHRLKRWRTYGLEKGLILNTSFIFANGQSRVSTLQAGQEAFLAIDTYFDEETSVADLTMTLPAGVVVASRKVEDFPRDLSRFVSAREELLGAIHFGLSHVPRGYWRYLIPVKALSAGRYSWPTSRLEAADASGRVAESAASVMTVR